MSLYCDPVWALLIISGLSTYAQSIPRHLIDIFVVLDDFCVLHLCHDVDGDLFFDAIRTSLKLFDPLLCMRLMEFRVLNESKFILGVYKLLWDLIFVCASLYLYHTRRWVGWLTNLAFQLSTCVFLNVESNKTWPGIPTWVLFHLDTWTQHEMHRKHVWHRVTNTFMVNIARKYTEKHKKQSNQQPWHTKNDQPTTVFSYNHTSRCAQPRNTKHKGCARVWSSTDTVLGE